MLPQRCIVWLHRTVIFKVNSLCSRHHCFFVLFVIIIRSLGVILEPWARRSNQGQNQDLRMWFLCPDCCWVFVGAFIFQSHSLCKISYLKKTPCLTGFLLVDFCLGIPLGTQNLVYILLAPMARRRVVLLSWSPVLGSVPESNRNLATWLSGRVQLDAEGFPLCLF